MAALDTRAFVLLATYRVRPRHPPEIHLHGVLEDGSSFLAVDERERPYCFVEARDAGFIGAAGEVEPTELRTFAGEPVHRVTVAEPGDIRSLREVLRERGVSLLESDLRFAQRYLIDRGIRSALRLQGEAGPGEGTAYKLINPTIAPAEFTPRLRVLALDIETNAETGALYAVSLACGATREVWLRYPRPVAGAQVVPDERTLIARCLARVRELDPDIITGWNVVDFDLRQLELRARRVGLELILGRSAAPLTFQRDLGFTRNSRATVPGRQVLDAMLLVRDSALKLDDYSLETASRRLLGRGKLIGPAGKSAEIERCYREEPEKLARYNLDDSELVLAILEKTQLVELTVERSLLTGMPLDRVGASVASFDSVYLPRLRARGHVAPSVDERTPEAIEGGYVLDSKPGLHPWIAVFDYRSLYPSVIRTFNIDPLGEALGRGEQDAIEAPNGARFTRGSAILPDLIRELARHRDQARREHRPLASHAIKILSNSFFGVLGTPGCRFFSPVVANAITQFGQVVIRATRDAFTELGYDVIYGDTDSLFVATRTAAEADARRIAADLLAAATAQVSAGIARRYGVESQLMLELAKVYRWFFMPELRGATVGSKKRYAGLLVEEGQEQLDVVGLESVRRDSPLVTREFQAGLFDRLFHERPLDPFIREVVADLKAGRLDAKLVIRKGLSKEVGDYVKTTPPHVKAARLAQGFAGGSIRYVMTVNGPEPVNGGERPTAPIDYDHYVTKHLKPVADSVLRLTDRSFEEVLRGQRQLRLF